ncbi:MAG: hypothetical protein LIO76_10075 [Clostridiales bacterium]|nr:hypothetical protein [Clostridiales bacterium]
MKTEEKLRRLRVTLELCRDRNTDADIGESLNRSIRLVKDVKDCDDDRLETLLEAVRELEDELRREDMYTARAEAHRLSELANELSHEPERKNRMGILSKMFGGRKSAEDIQRQEMDKQFQQAEENIMQLKRQISRLNDQWEACYGELQKLAEQSVKLDKNSPRYAQILTEAKGKQNRLKLLEAQIKQYSTAMQNNSEYQMLLDNGRISADLSRLMPDAAKAEVLMDQIVQDAEDVGEKVQDMGDLVERGSRRMLDAMGQGVSSPQDMDLFEQMQQTAAGQSETKQDVTEQAVPEKDGLQNETVTGIHQDEQRQEEGEMV